MWGTRRREPERAPVDSSLGQVLAARREGQGLSREAAAAQLDIPLRLLVALETDNFQAVPDARYLIRFVGEYGAFLGLEADALRARFLAANRQRFVPIPPPPEPFHWRELFRAPVLGIAIGVLVLVPIVFIVWSFLSNREIPQPPPPVPLALPPAVPRTAPPEAAPPAVPAAAEAPAPQPVVGVPSTLPVPGEARRGAGHTLRVVARELTWLAVAVDGGEAREAMLKPGDAATWKAEREVRVTIGNAGGVQLTLDGTALPSLGASGQVVRDLVLPRPPD